MEDIGSQPYTLSDKNRVIAEMLKDIPVFNQLTLDMEHLYQQFNQSKV
jgi:hypothetical protein